MSSGKRVATSEGGGPPAKKVSFSANYIPPSPESASKTAKHLVQAIANGSECNGAWSCTNLLALPTPRTSSLSTGPLTVTVTHFSGTSARPPATRGSTPSPRISFTLTIPGSSYSNARISKLLFSPCAAYLMVITTPTVNLTRGDTMTVFEQKSGCINEWELIWNEKVMKFGELPEEGEGKRVVQFRWLAEERKWYPPPEIPPEGGDFDTPSRPLYCAPKRFPSVVGSAIFVILSTSEILFIHFPRTTPLVPLTVVLPLASHLSLPALPTPPSPLPSKTNTAGGPIEGGHSSTTTSPRNTIDDLVAGLVDAMPSNGPSPSAVVGALGLAQGSDPTKPSDKATPSAGGGGTGSASATPAASGGATAGGVGALRDELRAETERRKKKEEVGATGNEKRRVKMAALGVARARQAPTELGTTRLLVASLSAINNKPPRPPPPPPAGSGATPAATPAPGIVDLKPSGGIDETLSSLTLPISLPDTISSLDTSNPLAGLTDSMLLNSPDFNMDFSALDEAFGMGPSSVSIPGIGDMEAMNLPPSAAAAMSDGDGARKRRKVDASARGESERVVDVCEVRVDMTAQGGPLVSLRPLAPIHLSDPSDFQFPANGVLTHLDWLEDISLPPPMPVSPKPLDHTSRTPPDVIKAENARYEAELASWKVKTVEREAREEGVDLRLVAIVASPTEDGYQSSSLASWAFSNPPYALSEAFSRLECKKADVSFGPREWTARRAASTTIPGLVSIFLPQHGPVFSSFLLGFTRKDLVDGNIVERTVIAPFKSTTLEQRFGDGETVLPGYGYYCHGRVSPSRSVLVAKPFTLPGKERPPPVIAAMPLASNEIALCHQLGVRLGQAIARQIDTSDLVGRVIGLKNDAHSLSIVRTLRDTMQGMMRPPGVQLETNSVQLEVLGMAGVIYKASPTLELRGTIAYDTALLAACTRAFHKCEKKNRGSVSVGYECESDAIWPLIGHLTWYCDFARDLVQECKAPPLNTADTKPNPRLILILHPLPRSLLLRAAECILGLQAFLAVFPINSNMTVDMSRNVLDDVVGFNGLVLREWVAALTRVGELDGLTGFASPDLQNMLVDFTIPDSLMASSNIAQAIISDPSLLLTTPPTPPATPLATVPSPELDIVRKGRLPRVGSFRECTKCGAKTERKEISVNEAGKWASVELSYEGRCACGGLWYVRDRGNGEGVV